MIDFVEQPRNKSQLEQAKKQLKPCYVLLKALKIGLCGGLVINTNEIGGITFLKYVICQNVFLKMQKSKLIFYLANYIHQNLAKKD